MLRAAEDRALKAEAQALLLESRITELGHLNEVTLQLAREDRESLREENKKLLDRIIQMTGQPPIFSPAPTPATPPVQPAPETSSIPAPQLRPSFDDVHRVTRKAIADGSINLTGVR